MESIDSEIVKLLTSTNNSTRIESFQRLSDSLVESMDNVCIMRRENEVRVFAKGKSQNCLMLPIPSESSPDDRSKDVMIGGTSGVRVLMAMATFNP